MMNHSQLFHSSFHKKGIRLTLLCCRCVAFLPAALLHAGNFPYGTEFEATNPTNSADPSNPFNALKTVIIEEQGQNDSFWESILQVFWFNFGQQWGGSTADTIFSYVQGIANIALGLLAFVSLIILIYNFAMIFVSKEKEGVENAQKVVTRVLYVLMIIWLSWMIVSFIFRAVSKFIN